MALDNYAIHAALGPEGWRNTLMALGIAENFLRNKHGPCPTCGGKDRFRFDNKRGQGTFYCTKCGAGDGFKLIMLVFGTDFREARKRVIEAARLDGSQYRQQQQLARVFPAPEEKKISAPTSRVRSLLRESCVIENCESAIAYLDSRKLWPLPPNHRLRAHPSVDYFEDGNVIGKYPALIGEVRDIMGELVTLHVTYLEPDGRKLSQHEPRKILSEMKGRESCAVPLMQIQDETLGIAEGIETALSASILHEGMPVWSTLNTSLLQKFDPPAHICKLVVFVDRDVAGLEAALKLMERLQERVRLEIKSPTKRAANDWNDQLKMTYG